MGIFDRMGRVISSNVNSMLDKAEDDKKLLELNLGSLRVSAECFSLDAGSGKGGKRLPHIKAQ